jgi:hypothetical protein
MIPDLHTIFRGGMAAFVNIHELKLYSDPKLGGDELDDVGAKKIREQLIADQVSLLLLLFAKKVLSLSRFFFQFKK